MSEVTARLGRTFGTAALYAIGIPMIVIGMLLVLLIAAYDTVERRFRKTTERQP